MAQPDLIPAPGVRQFPPDFVQCGIRNINNAQSQFCHILNWQDEQTINVYKINFNFRLYETAIPNSRFIWRSPGSHRPNPPFKPWHGGGMTNMGDGPPQPRHL